MRRYFVLLLSLVLAASTAGAQMRPGRGNSRQQMPDSPKPWQNPQRDQSRGESRRGDWLRNHQNLPPEQQERELQNDPGFRTLPQQRQQQLREQLRNFNSMPPQQRMQMLHRMERWDQFTPQQRDRARGLISRFQELPPDRQQMLRRTARNLGGLSPQDRERALDSPMIRDTFTDSERETLREMLELRIVPGTQGQARP